MFQHRVTFVFTMLSDSFKLEAIVFRLGQKKSEAATPTNPKRKSSQRNFSKMKQNQLII